MCTGANSSASGNFSTSSGVMPFASRRAALIASFERPSNAAEAQMKWMLWLK